MFYGWSVNNGVWIVQIVVVINMPVYDDPDYAWKQMMKKEDKNDPFTNPSKEVKEAMEKIKEYERKAKERLYGKDL